MIRGASPRRSAPSAAPPSAAPPFPLRGPPSLIFLTLTLILFLCIDPFGPTRSPLVPATSFESGSGPTTLCRCSLSKSDIAGISPSYRGACSSSIRPSISRSESPTDPVTGFEVLRSSGWALALDLAMDFAALEILVIGFAARRASDVWDVATSGAACDPVVSERVAYLSTGTTTSAMSRLREDVDWALAVDASR